MSVNEPGFPSQPWDGVSPQREGGGGPDRSPNYEDWDQAVAELRIAQKQFVRSGIIDDTPFLGAVVYMKSNGHFALALANLVDTATGIGFITKISGTTISVQLSGVAILSGLTPGTTYYIHDSVAGTLRTTPGTVPRTAGVALTATELAIALATSSGTTGPTGPQGPQGDPGADGSSFIWRGDWDSVTNYVINDVVFHLGSAYIATADNDDEEPPNALFWDLMAQKGDTGATGATGATGDTGATGAAGADGLDINWLGPWSNLTAYVINDAVENDGSSYICTEAHTNQEPPNVTYWDLMAQKGDTGATGAAGADAPEYGGTSTTSLAFGVGTKTFTTQAGLAWVAGSRIRAISAASLDYMEGIVSSYSGTTLEIAVDRETGSGTHADWSFSLAGDPGSNGLEGNDGANGADGLVNPGGRLTVSTGVPVTSADVNNSANLYYTPYLHNQIVLYNGSAWVLLTFSETAVTIPSTTNTNYDVFAYNNSGTVAFETVNWSDNTTRATALAVQDGRYVKSGDATRLYIGTGRTGASSATQTDSNSRRRLFNMYNRVARILRIQEAATSWNYNSSAWRQVNANSSNELQVVIGVAGPIVDLKHTMVASMGSASHEGYIGIGLDTVGNSGLVGYLQGTGKEQMVANYGATLAVGFHTLTPVERVNTSTTQTITIDNISSELWGILGTIEDI